MRALDRTPSRLTAMLLGILGTLERLQQDPHCRLHPVTLRSLLALCYLTDRDAYRQHLTSLSHATYRARAEGPVPDGFYRLITRLARRGRIRLTPPFQQRPLTDQDLDRIVALPPRNRLHRRSTQRSWNTDALKTFNI